MKKDLRQYIAALEKFCIAYTTVATIGEQVDFGEVVDKDGLDFSLFRLELYKNELLSAKRLIGLADNLDFLTENLFSVGNKRLGEDISYEEAYTMAKYYMKYTEPLTSLSQIDEESCRRLELGCLLTYMLRKEGSL